MSVGSFSQYRYTTDTLPILDRQFHRYIADTLPMLSRPTVGRSVDRQETPLGRYIDRIMIDNRTILDRISTDMAADMSINSRPRNTPRKTHDPINLL